MANGDEAAAAGLAVFAPIQDLRQGYDNDNVRGDELARHMQNGTHPFSKITGQIAPAQIPTNGVTPTKLQKRYAAGYTDPVGVDTVETITISTGLTGPQVVTCTPIKAIPGESAFGHSDGWVVVRSINYTTGVATVDVVNGRASSGGVGLPFTARIGWQAVMI